MLSWTVINTIYPLSMVNSYVTGSPFHQTRMRSETDTHSSTLCVRTEYTQFNVLSYLSLFICWFCVFVRFRRACVCVMLQNPLKFRSVHFRCERCAYQPNRQTDIPPTKHAHKTSSRRTLRVAGCIRVLSLCVRLMLPELCIRALCLCFFMYLVGACHWTHVLTCILFAYMHTI